jgi:hypothetical protein
LAFGGPATAHTPALCAILGRSVYMAVRNFDFFFQLKEKIKFLSYAHDDVLLIREINSVMFLGYTELFGIILVLISSKIDVYTADLGVDGWALVSAG